MAEAGGEVASGRVAGVLRGEAEGARAMEEHGAWPMLSRLPVTLAVGIPLRRFRVCDLVALRSGQTIETAWAVTEDVPLATGEVQVAWGEFETVEERMALRLTRLA
jgi:flagellar motor switch protein FliN/FliY